MMILPLICRLMCDWFLDALKIMHSILFLKNGCDSHNIELTAMHRGRPKAEAGIIAATLVLDCFALAISSNVTA
jgi:hypothetical protein